MKKVLIIVILVVAVIAAGVGVGYLMKEKGLLNSDDKTNNETVATEPSTKECADNVDIEKVYNDYLDSEEAEKYYHLLEGDEELKYSGKKDFNFFDIDGDGVAECFLRVGYCPDGEGPESGREEQILLFDADGENVRLVMSTGACAPYRAYEKIRLIKTENDTYEIFRYVRDANKILEGTVYSYDGKTIKSEKSFFADIYPFIYDEKTFFVSTTNDLFDETAANYADREAAEKIAENAFYEQWNYYESEAECVYQAPEQTEAN